MCGWSVYVSGGERREQMLFRFNCPQSISQQRGIMAESTDSGACLQWNWECVCRLLIYFSVSVCEVGCYDERHERGSSLKRGRHTMSARKVVVTVICLLFIFYVVDSRQPNLHVWFGESCPDPGLMFLGWRVLRGHQQWFHHRATGPACSVNKGPASLGCFQLNDTT